MLRSAQATADGVHASTYVVSEPSPTAAAAHLSHWHPGQRPASPRLLHSTGPFRADLRPIPVQPYGRASKPSIRQCTKFQSRPEPRFPRNLAWTSRIRCVNTARSAAEVPDPLASEKAQPNRDLEAQENRWPRRLFTRLTTRQPSRKSRHVCRRIRRSENRHPEAIGSDPTASPPYPIVVDA